MSNTTSSRSRGFGLRRRMGAIACIAMNFIWACSAHTDAMEYDETIQDDHEAVEKAAFLDAVAGAGSCQNCETKEVCVDKFEPCNPPILVGGRNTTCLVKECTLQRVCTPCGSEGALAPELDLPVVDLDNLPFGPRDPRPLPL